MISGGGGTAAARVPAKGNTVRRRLLASVGLLALVVIGIFCWPESGPRYRGRGVHAYFPVWEGPSARTGLRSRFPDDAGPDAVLFLIEVSQLPEAGFQDRLAARWDLVPASLQRFLPRPVGIRELRNRAGEELLLLAGRPDCLPEIVRRFDEFPLGTRHVLLGYLGNLSAQTNEVLPLLRRVVRGTNAPLRQLAASTALGMGDTGLPLLPDVLAYLETLEVPTAKTSRLQQVGPGSHPSGICRKAQRFVDSAESGTAAAQARRRYSS